MAFRVLITAPYFIPVLEQYRERLVASNIDIVTVPVKERLTEGELLPLIDSIDGAICGDDQFTRRVLERGRRLKVISKWGTGIDSIDVGAAAELGIRVCNTANAFTDAVADSTLGYILSFARRLVRMNDDMRSGLWQKLESSSLNGLTLGVVGVGHIGRAVARRACAFGMRLVGTDPIQPSEDFLLETQLKMVSLSELLRDSDFITLHCDLNPTSFHLIDKAEFDLMRSSSYLINTSRGPVVHETALIDALRERQIAGAALDVFEIEPLPLDSALRSMENCLLAPHNANSDRAAHMKVHELTIANLIRGLGESSRKPEGR